MITQSENTTSPTSQPRIEAAQPQTKLKESRVVFEQNRFGGKVSEAVDSASDFLEKLGNEAATLCRSFSRGFFNGFMRGHEQEIREWLDNREQNSQSTPRGFPSINPQVQARALDLQRRVYEVQNSASSQASSRVLEMHSSVSEAQSNALDQNMVK